MNKQAIFRIEPTTEVLAATRHWLEQVRPALGHEFLACYLTGSVLTQGFEPQRSHVNVLVVARTLDIETLDHLARALPQTKKPPHFEPLFLTMTQIEESLDVFPIEWLDIHESHLLIEGQDVITPLQVPRTYLRLQCEHELRGNLIQLRKNYVMHAKNPDRLEPTLRSSASGFAALFRTLLRLHGESPPADTPRVIERVAHLYGLQAEALLGVWLVRHGERRHRGVELLAIYRKVLIELERLVGALDAMRVP